MTKFRTRVFCSVLYEEDETHKKAIDFIKRNYDHAIICHDKDVYLEDVIRDGELVHKKGELEKPHYQIVFRFSHARWSTAVAEELGITDNYLEAAETFKGAIEYLIHFNNPEKYQYTIDEVSGPLKSQLEEFVNNAGKTEGEKIIEMFNWIDDRKRCISYSEFYRSMAELGYWDTLRRSGSLVTRYLDEHNSYLL